MYMRAAMFTTAPFLSGDIKSSNSQSATEGGGVCLTDTLLKECSVTSEQSFMEFLRSLNQVFKKLPDDKANIIILF